MIFGKDRSRGIRLHGINPEVVHLGSGIKSDDLLIHDEKAAEPTLAYLLSRMVHDPADKESFPEVVGVLRAVERPTHHELVEHQIHDITSARGKGNLQDLLTGDETWTVS
jgi:2-oxoglutarate ferredoxin oxidoreductase subunit beta